MPLFVGLGRATVMIKGIANRLGLRWGLSDRWAKVALEAVQATDPMEQLPIWSVLTPTGPFQFIFLIIVYTILLLSLYYNSFVLLLFFF